MKKIVVLGATGRTGYLAVSEAAARGYDVTAVCRNLPSSEYFPGSVHLVIGTLEDRNTLSSAFNGADAVFCTLGPRPPLTEIFCAAATAAILETMVQTNVRRLLCVTGAMVGQYPDSRSFFFDLMASTFARRMPEAANDRVHQERMIMESDTDWTIVKPPRLNDSTARGTYRAGPKLSVGLMSTVSRVAVARFLLDEFESRKFIRQCIFIKN